MKIKSILGHNAIGIMFASELKIKYHKIGPILRIKLFNENAYIIWFDERILNKNIIEKYSIQEVNAGNIKYIHNELLKSYSFKKEKMKTNTEDYMKTY